MEQELKDLGGLVNKDIAFSKLKSDLVYDSVNFRISTDEGKTFAVRTNTKGTTHAVNIPPTPSELKITLDETPMQIGTSYSIIFTIASSSEDVLTFNFVYSSIVNFYEELALFFNTYVNQPSHSLYNSVANVALNNSYLYINAYIDSLIITSFVGTTGGVNTISYLSYITVSSIKPIQRNLKIIGWTTIRDTIFLLTTNGSFDPDITTGTSYGQWWKLTYGKDKDPTDPSIYNLQLIYNDVLDLTIHRPVANPGMIEARYENINVQPIYWTDVHNTPRKINTADPSLATLEPNRLRLLPSLSMQEPELVEIVQGGNLKNGVYQVIYRLKNINGAETKFSRPSKFIPIIDAGEQENYTEYYPQLGGAVTAPGVAGTNINSDANKSIKIKIDNIDSNFSIIEFVTIYYKDNTSVPEFYIVKEDAIPETKVYEGVIDSTVNDIPITLDEVTAFNTAILKCKTLATKSQTLFLGGVELSDQVVNFDTRAYRYPKNFPETTIQQDNQDVYTLDANSQVIKINGAPVNIPVPAECDCIQTYDEQGPELNSNKLYQPNSSILGGKGPNVTYQFVTEEIILDEITTPSTTPWQVVSQSSFTLLNINDGDVKNNNTFRNYKSPYLYDVMAGYRRDEMERFAMVFFDELDNPTYASWIADIRFPHMFMPDPAIPGNTKFQRVSLNPTNYAVGNTGTDKFISKIATAKSASAADTAYVGHPMGIKFTIDFSSLPAKYKKVAIVRYPKADSDKHILGQGFIRPTIKEKGDGGPDNIFTGIATRKGLNSTLFTDGLTWPWYFTLVSPEFNFKALSSSAFQAQDRLDIIAPLRKFTKYNQTTPFNFNYLQDYLGNFISPTLHPGQGSNDKFYGIVTKNYEIESDVTMPNTIKNTNSNNPYEVIFTKLIDNPFETPTTSFADAYNVGRSLDDTANFGDSSKDINNCTPKRKSDGGWFPVSSPYPSGIEFSHCNRSLFVQIKAGAQSNNWNIGIYGGHNFLLQDKMDQNLFSGSGGVPDDDAKGLNGYIGNYKRSVANQFGGNTFAQRSASSYIPTGAYINIPDKTALSQQVTTKVFGGDTIITIVDYMMQFADLSNSAKVGPSQITHFLWASLFPCETSVNIDLRRNSINSQSKTVDTLVPNRNAFLGAKNENDPIWGPQYFKSDVKEYFSVDKVFNYTNKGYIKYYPKPYLIDPPTKFDARIWRSEKKIDGELADSWSIFKPFAFLDVESKYGPLTNLLVFQDKLYFFQDKAFGTLQVAEQKLISDAAGGADFIIGSTGILERYDYVSIQTGTKSQFSMSISDYSLMWFDTLAKKLYRYKPGSLEPLSDLKGYHAFINENTKGDLQIFDNPYLYRGVHSTYDYRFNEFLTTAIQDSNNFTLVYSDLFDGYVGEYTQDPVVYINDKSNIFSVPYSPIGTADKILLHNFGPYGVYNGVKHPSKLSFVINGNPTVEKVLTNLEFSTESYRSPGFSEPEYYDFFNTMRVYDQSQNTDLQQLVPNLARKHKTLWNVKVPSDRVLDVTQNIFNALNLATVRPALTKRLKDKWFVVDMIYNNDNNYKFIAHTAKAMYNLNSR